MSVVRRFLGFAFLLAIGVDLVILAWVGYAIRYDRTPLLMVRDASFTRFTSDPGLFALPPSKIPGFSVDDPQLVEEWKARLPKQVEYLREVRSESLPHETVARAKAVVLLFSKNGGGPDSCGSYRDLLHNIERLPEGEGQGCCSDHTEVFLALSSIYGLDARETHQRGHTHAEFYDPAREKWIWIDPYLALMARSKDAEYLSYLEMRERYLADRSVEFVFFGTPDHRVYGGDARDIYLYDEKEDLWEASLTLGNNVFAQDAFARRVRFLPREAGQFVAFLIGRQPPYLLLVDDYDDEARALRIRRRRLVVGGAILLAAHLGWPLALTFGRLLGDGLPRG